MANSIDSCHCDLEGAQREEARRWEHMFREYGAGLGVRFGKDMYKATGVPVGLLMCSHGGTSLAQWNPALRGEGGKSLYGSMLRRVREAGGRVAGCLWYQGESDAMTEAWPDYEKNFRDLIENFRADFDMPDMPFIYVQIGPYLWFSPELVDGWNGVQTAQVALEPKMDNIAMVSAIDCTMSDHIHIDAISQRKLGAKMALLARRLCFGEDDIQSGPRPAECSFTDESRTRIRVRFSGVNKGLRPASAIRGFTVEAGESQIAIVKCVRESGDPCSVIITLEEAAPEGAVLWHAKGINPARNLTDALGFAVPVFGPIKL
jgi:sialate O-acetylesterase